MDLTLNRIPRLNPRRLWLLLALIVLLPTHSLASPEFSGSAACASCHEAEHLAWQNSHHDLAMQHATDDTVLGDFNDASVTTGGVTSRFFRRDGEFWVHTDAADGQMRDFQIGYAFGVEPLQQYLVAFPDGRLQALSLAWDSRSLEAGGQRWFHLYPDETITHDDPLHWTGPQQNWNYMCADCHSTELRKNYDAANDRFATTWSEIDVSCEACHGPASNHVAWANQPDGLDDDDVQRGLVVLLHDRKGVTWPIDTETGIARRQGPDIGRREIAVCAACHSRRGQLAEGMPREPVFLDHYQPAFLTGDLYHDDGQIQDEVYVWGSYLQSRMYAAGVTCSDCHDPHSLELRAPGDAVCAQCHAPATFATEAHTHHPPESSGADCLGCHMPERNYMVVDPRRDHSMRIPRPDLSDTFNTPNACTQCHTDRDNAWASEAFQAWYPDAKAPFQDWAKAFSLARSGQPQAEVSLLSVINDADTPDIARATAVLELRNHLGPLSGQMLRAAVQDVSPLVRIAALRTLDVLPNDQRLAWTGFLLNDPYRAVRTEAARLLAAAPASQFSPEQARAMARALEEYRDSQLLHADRAEAQLNLGNLAADTGDAASAEQHYRLALKRDDTFSPAWLNLADLYRNQGLNREAERLLREGIQRLPDDAALHHSLGLALVRAQRMGEALPELDLATRLAPEAPRYGYVYGVALHSAGQMPAALSVLQATHQRHPNDRAVLAALANFLDESGDSASAVAYARKLVALNPADSRAAELLQQLEARAQ